MTGIEMTLETPLMAHGLRNGQMFERVAAGWWRENAAVRCDESLSGRWATSTAIGRRGAVGCFADPAHGQNRQAEIPNSREQSMECRLIDDWADQHGCAVVLPINREAIKPIRPGVIDVSPKMDLIGVGPTSEGACRRVVGVHCLFTLIWML